MSIVADQYRYVVGVDTHAATHTYAIIEAPLGQLVDQACFPTSQAGLDRALAWIGRRTGGDLQGVLIAAEGTGSYGQVLAERATEVGYRVIEAPTPTRDRGAAKTDRLDALTAAVATLASDADRLRDRRAGQLQASLNILSTARDQMSSDRTRNVNALTALLRSHDLGLDARKKLTKAQIAAVASWRRRPTDTTADAVARAEAIRLATRITDLDTELKTNRAQIADLVTTHAPHLLAVHGIGPITAATVLATWSHLGRIRSEAALARLAGTAPVPASSGNTSRHRLSRGGDRHLNRALHTVALSRMRSDKATQNYIARRTAEGKTPREIQRLIKRYATRQIYRLLAANPPTLTA